MNEDMNYESHFEFQGLVQKNLQVFAAELGLTLEEGLELYREFSGQTSQIIERFETSLAHKDFETIKKQSHQIKGTASNLRIEEVFHIARSLEIAALESDESQCEKLCRQLSQLMERIIAELN